MAVTSATRSATRSSATISLCRHGESIACLRGFVKGADIALRAPRPLGSRRLSSDLEELSQYLRDQQGASYCAPDLAAQNLHADVRHAGWSIRQAAPRNYLRNDLLDGCTLNREWLSRRLRLLVCERIPRKRDVGRWVVLWDGFTAVKLSLHASQSCC
jgi:hypothetical protein